MFVKHRHYTHERARFRTHQGRQTCEPILRHNWSLEKRQELLVQVLLRQELKLRNPSVYRIILCLHG